MGVSSSTLTFVPSLIVYFVLSGIIIFAVFQDKYQSLVGYLISGIIILFALDLFIKFFNKNGDTIDFQTTFGKHRDNFESSSSDSSSIQDSTIEADIVEEKIIEDDKENKN